MTKFTKEQLIERAQDEIEDVTTPVCEYPLMLTDVGRMNLQLMEIALAALTAEPFMYGIVGPEGEAYFDECCVSGGKSDLSEIVSNLNDQCESPGEEYREAPLYRMPLLEGLK